MITPYQRIGNVLILLTAACTPLSGVYSKIVYRGLKSVVSHLKLDVVRRKGYREALSHGG